MEQCPICYGELEVRECAPCDDCGGNVPTEIDHFHQEKHTYTVFEVYKGLRLTLCDFCAVDFGSHHPEYFGFKDRQPLSFSTFNFIKQVDTPVIVNDKFCRGCSARLKFLQFVLSARELNQ